MGFRNLKSAPADDVDVLPRDAVSGQPLFSLFNKLAMAPRKGEGGFAVQILGPHSGCGVSSIAGRLAEFSAVNVDGPVALVDADPLKMTQFRRTGTDFVSSLQEVQQGKVGLDAAIHRGPAANLSLLALTSPVADRDGFVGRSLSISALGDIVAILRKRFSWIVVDSGPARDLAFAHVLSRFVDGTVVVAESERTRLPVVHQLIHQIYANGGSALGVVINKRRMLISDFLYRFL
jgi:Mrp family chromosome partitioning ATPase